MTIPTWFEEEWNETFRGRFRIRWSAGKNRWQVEQKMARAVMQNRPIHHDEDDKIRERDGFELFAEICPGSRLKCDRCKRWIQASIEKFKTTKCSHCRKEHKAFFYTLGPALLQHMRRVDPYTGGIERVFEEVDSKTFSRDLSRRRDRQNYGEAVIKQDYNHIHDIPSWGYVGKSNRLIHRDKGIK
jgi:hypothetical protein